MPRLLDPVTDLEEIEKIIKSSHFVEATLGEKRKIVSSVKDANIAVHKTAFGTINIYGLFIDPSFKRRKAFREGGGVYFFVC